MSGFAALFVAAVLALPSVRATASPAKAVQSLVDSAIDAWVPDVADPVAAARYEPNDGLSPITSWRSSLGEFAERDRLTPPASGGVVFVGSSSLRLWGSLASDFPALNVINRGFGGSLLADCARYADRLVLPYRPRTVVVYAGDNDLASGASPQDVLDAYASLVHQVHAALPQAHVAFVSIKPSPARAVLLPAIVRTNELVRAFTKTQPTLDYIDVHARMLDEHGQPRAELFRDDGLHLNAAGYALWQSVIGPHLH